MDQSVHARDEAIQRLQSLLTHPDDLHTKVPLLRKKIEMERSAVVTQLLSGVRHVLDDVKRMSMNLTKSKSDVLGIGDGLGGMDKSICDAQKAIQDFEFIRNVIKMLKC